MIVGITGGSGCGKTTALQAFASLGGKVLDCDRIYHQLLQTDKAMLSAIEQAFPGTVIGGELDRKKLGAVVFADPKALQQLNTITHSAVKREVLQQLKQWDGHAAIDAIGLFEGGLAELCHVTVAITAPEEKRVARLMTRDGITEEYARARINAQRSQAEFSALCQHTLCNDGTEEEFTAKCLVFFTACGIMDTSKEKENKL